MAQHFKFFLRAVQTVHNSLLYWTPFTTTQITYSKLSCGPSGPNVSLHFWRSPGQGRSCSVAGWARYNIYSVIASSLCHMMMIQLQHVTVATMFDAFAKNQ